MGALHTTEARPGSVEDDCDLYPLYVAGGAEDGAEYVRVDKERFVLPQASGLQRTAMVRNRRIAVSYRIRPFCRPAWVSACWRRRHGGSR